jgi:4-diphosphocytidyl-2-C-methyl-D-erythritol kinase
MADRRYQGAVLRSRAPAKVNLTLHVLGRRPDGYHALDSLVAFAGVSDHLELRPGPDLSLGVDGPNAAAAGEPADNLVLRGVRALLARRPNLTTGAFRLWKRLPAAAGIGGGSSDAAAALRLLARANGLAPGHPDVEAAARDTGADVAVCLDPRARTMRGAGEDVGPPLALPPLFAVLVNPGIAVPTPAVFRALGLDPGAGSGSPSPPPHAVDAEALIRLLADGRNDLEPAAVSLAPVIGHALSLIRGIGGCRLARMSGSGSTVFGLYDGRAACVAAAKAIARAEPGWWVRATVLR